MYASCNGQSATAITFFVFIVHRVVSALQSHNQALHKHEMDNSTWVEGGGLAFYDIERRYIL
jgi:hypothetical protein